MPVRWRPFSLLEQNRRDPGPPVFERAEHGYPQLTEQAKRKILGENLLRLHGMDVEDTRTRLAAG